MAMEVVPNEKLPQVKIVANEKGSRVWINGKEIKTLLALKMEADVEPRPRVTLSFEADVNADIDGVENV